MLNQNPTPAVESPGDPVKFIPLLAALGIILFILLTFLPDQPPTNTMSVKANTSISQTNNQLP